MGINGIGTGYYSNPYIGFQGIGKSENQYALGAANASLTGSKIDADEKTASIKNPGESQEKKAGRKSSPAECETCANRKYQDGSDEMVSFKSPSHISPESAASRVRAHEQEHVSNAYKKAEQNNGKVVNANVSIQTSICPECGRSFVSGGLTTTQIKYSDETNPYQKNAKSQDAAALRGMNLDLAV